MSTNRVRSAFAHALPLLLVVTAEVLTARADHWIDRTGKHQIEATFVRIADDAVVLRKKDRSEITVPLDRLDEVSRRLAQDRAAEVEKDGEAPGPSKIPTFAEFTQAARGTIRPEDNAVVAFWSAVGVDAIHPREDMRRRYLEALGADVARTDAPFLPWAQFLKSEGRNSGDDINVLKSTDVDAVDRWLTRNRQSLDAAVAAFQRPAYYSPMVLESEDDFLWQASIPIASPARDVLRALVARVRSHLRHGEVDAAADDAIASLRWARLVSREDTLAALFLSRAMEQVAVDTIGEVTHDGRFSRKVAERMAKQIASLPAKSDFVEKLKWEKLAIMVEVSRIAEGGPKALTAFIVAFVGEQSPESVAWADTLVGKAGIAGLADRWNPPDRKIWISAIAELGAKFDAYERALKSAPVKDRMTVVPRLTNDLTIARPGPLNRLFRKGERSPADIELMRRLVRGSLPPGTTAEDVAQLIHGITCPDLRSAARLDAKSSLRDAALPVVFALGLRHAEQDGYPVRLQDLVPDYLDEVPKDPLFDQPFEFEWEGTNGYRLYSAGPDGFPNGGDSETSEDIDNLGIIVVPPKF